VRLFDTITLVIIIGSGLWVGETALFGVPLVSVEPDTQRVIGIVIGLSAIWQLMRQKFH